MTENLNNKRISESSYWQAEKFAGNDDLLTEFLLLLPGTSLLRFRAVSPHWRYIISDPDFRKLHSRRSATAVTDGLLLFRKSDKKNYHLDHFLNFSDPGKHLVPSNIRNFVGSFRLVEPMHYCNGLFCLKLNLDNDEVFYCVYNPCTNRYTNIPKPDVDNADEIVSMNLAFDPLKSSDYKIVCIVRKGLWFRFLTFCSENNTTTTWKESGQQSHPIDYYFMKGVFLNGAIHLVSKNAAFLCFDVDNEHLKTMPRLSNYQRIIKYFGESGGRLYLIDVSVVQPTLLNVFELEKDYSKWSTKYVVDFNSLTRVFPLMVINEPETLDVIGYHFDVLSFLDGEKDGKPMLVLSLPEKIVSYNIKNMEIKELMNVQLEELHFSREGYLVYNYNWCHAFKYVETLALV